MKPLITTAVLTLIITFSANAQKTSSALSPVLSFYYNVKDALVNSDANEASSKAGGLVKTINSIDLKTIAAAEQRAFGVIKDKLVFDANNISETKNLEKQRAFFSSLSTNIYSLTKVVKLTDQVVYQAYCPMKKTFWLSKEPDIKNPYYGNQMLSCGKVNDMLK